MDQRIVGPVLVGKDKSDGIQMTFVEQKKGQPPVRTAVRLSSVESFKLATLLLSWVEQDWLD
jgi:hypothetical protein